MVPVHQPRMQMAGNAGPFTLDGTRTYLIGKEQVAVIDPGPDVEEHVRALVQLLAEAREVRILLTHTHGDHAAAAPALAEAIGGQVLGPPSPGTRDLGRPSRGDASRGRGAAFRSLTEGDVVPTDAGPLVVLKTPGHTADHLSYRWGGGQAVFVGDLLLGRGSTTWLGEYPGCVKDFLMSLERVRALEARVLYPSHGPPITSPGRTLDRFRAHRVERLRQLQAALDADPFAGPETLARAVYGSDLPETVIRAARASVEVMLHHLRGDRPDT